MDCACQAHQRQGIAHLGAVGDPAAILVVFGKLECALIQRAAYENCAGTQYACLRPVHIHRRAARIGKVRSNTRERYGFGDYRG